MVFGDNVRARMAARALPRTPTTRRRKKKRKEEEGKRRDHTPSHPTAIPQPTTQCDKTRHALSSHSAITHALH